MRAFLQRPTLRVSFMAALAFLLAFSTVAGTADAKKKKKKPILPIISSIKPAKVAVNDTLVIKGKNFRVGAAKNTVLFRNAAGGKVIFGKTLAATTKRIVLKVPAAIATQLDATNGVSAPTKFQIRVVGARAGAFSTVSKSPTILPMPGGSITADCDGDKIPDQLDADDDNDGLSDAIEIQYGLNTCKTDTDGDGVWDSYEFESALDLNNRGVPFPGKKPWPNALDGSDARDDFDGDGLKMNEEHKLWQAAGRPAILNYSDGTQYTGGPIEAPNPDPNGLDIDKYEKGGPNSMRTGTGFLSDEERDFDNDGLGNLQEFSFRMTQGYWLAESQDSGEGIYPLRHFSDLDPTDPDSDGDGVLDGFDDQDNDGWTNIQEQYRRPTYATGMLAYMVQPFNPCLPDYESITCSRYLIAGTDPWSPFDLIPMPVAPIGWDTEAHVPKNSPTPGQIPIPGIPEVSPTP